MDTKYTPSHVANFFLDKSFDEDDLVDALKLLKLVYIGYGWVLAILDRTLFDDKIEAWENGPVIPSLYNEFKHFGEDSIKFYAIDLNLETLETTIPRISKKDEKVINVLDFVWDIYNQFTGRQLSDMTHKSDTPWSEAYNENKQCQIPDNLIQKHFQERITKYLDASQATEST